MVLRLGALRNKTVQFAEKTREGSIVLIAVISGLTCKRGKGIILRYIDPLASFLCLSKKIILDSGLHSKDSYSSEKNIDLYLANMSFSCSIVKQIYTTQPFWFEHEVCREDLSKNLQSKLFSVKTNFMNSSFFALFCFFIFYLFFRFTELVLPFGGCHWYLTWTVSNGKYRTILTRYNTAHRLSNKARTW